MLQNTSVDSRIGSSVQNLPRLNIGLSKSLLFEEQAAPLPHVVPRCFDGKCPFCMVPPDLSEAVVRAAFCLALWCEMAVFQQLRSIFVQEPLDGSCARSMQSNVDIADAFLREISIVLSIDQASERCSRKSDP